MPDTAGATLVNTKYSSTWVTHRMRYNQPTSTVRFDEEVHPAQLRRRGVTAGCRGFGAVSRWQYSP
jgi:hypothetical protein